MNKIRYLFALALCILICSCVRINGYGEIRVINNSDYHIEVIPPEWGDNGVGVLDEDRVGKHYLGGLSFNVSPHTSRTIALWALKNHYDELFEDGVICFTILDSAVVKHFTSAEIAAGKLYLARYFITLDQLPEYMPRKNLLSITYPSVDGKDLE